MVNSPWNQQLAAAKEAAQVARGILLHYFGQISQIEEKFHAGLVSEADRESEKAIQACLNKYFPDYSFLGEEGAYLANENPQDFVKKNNLWVVDPLDGTTNYVHGFPIFCSSIGLQVQGEIVVGVIDAPVLNQTFYAVRGGGAFLNDKPISVSKTRELASSLPATGFFADDHEALQEHLRIYQTMAKKVRGLRRAGAAAYDLAMVSCGVFDFFWESRLKPWDTAAGMLLVAEAGGEVLTYQGEAYSPYAATCLATNKLLTQAALEIIKRS